MRWFVVAILGGALACLVPSAAQAQIFARPGVGGAFGSPFGGFASPFGYGYGGGLFGPGTLPTPGLYGQTPYNVVPTIVTPNATQVGDVLGSPLDTGHPTRFASYSQYFSNQGGGYVTPQATTPVSRAGTGPTLGVGVGGTRSTTPPSRSGSAATPPKTP